MFNVEFLIARRLSRSENRSRNLMVRLAVVTVALSVAVMVVALAVISGFRQQISDKLAGFGAHVQVVNLYFGNSYENAPIARDTTLEKHLAAIEGCRSVVPFAAKGGVISSPEAMQGVMLKGVAKNYDWSFFEANLTEGSLPRFSDTTRYKDILISQHVASQLRLAPGDQADMMFVGSSPVPRRDRFKVSGIYRTGLEELDKVMTLTDIRNVQRLDNRPDSLITGYEIVIGSLDDLDRFEAAARRIIATEKTIPQQLKIENIKERFVFLFDWLATHDVNATVVIVIMLIVALINMIAAMLIIILERIHMIAILKTLGMTNISVRKVFVYHCGAIILKGMAWGNAIGLSLCLLQRYTGVLKLNQENYFLSQVPIEIGWWIVPLNLVCFCILLMLLIVPTMIITRVQPEKTLRFK